MSEHDPQAPRVRSGRINLGAPVPMAKVTARVEHLDGQWVEFIWPLTWSLTWTRCACLAWTAHCGS